MRRIAAFGRVLRRLDPREAALRFPNMMVVVFVLLVALFLYGNMQTKKGGVLDNAILDSGNPTIAHEAYVNGKAVEGFRPTEVVSLVFRFGHRGDAMDYRRVVCKTHELELTFGNRVLSLATVPNFRDNGEEMDDTPYLTDELFAKEFDRDAWERAVAEDASVYGILVGKDFTWAIVFLYLEPEYDEMMTFRQIVELLEGRTIPWYEWWWKRSITPNDPTLGVGGWVIGRGMIDQTLNVDVLMLVAVGLVCLFPLFWNKFGSGRLAAIATFGIVGTSILLVRGSIGLLDIVGWPVRERVYVLLAYANCVVQGVSFALHRFEGLHEHEGSLTDRLRATVSVDRMIGLTATVAIFGFATLWWFEVLPIREFGILAALGVLYTFVLTSVFGLSFICLVGGKLESRTMQGKGVVTKCAESLMLLLVQWLRILQPKQRQALAWGVLALPCIGAVIILGNGKIVARSKALEYIRGTLVEETAIFLNESKRPGFEYLDLFVEPVSSVRSDVTIDEPQFLCSVYGFIARVRSETNAREVMSVVTNVERVSAILIRSNPKNSDVVRRHNLWIPETEGEAREAFFMVENAIGPALREQWWCDRGLRISVSMQMDDSVALGRFIADVQSIAKDYPELRVTPFGKVPVYPEVDRYIREGKPWNAISSQGVIVVIMFLWLIRLGYRARSVRIRPFMGACVLSLPFVFAGALLVIVMGWWEIPLDNAVAAITALAINAAIDFALYLVAAYHEALRETADAEKAWELALTREGTLLLLDAGLNIICFAPLTLSHFEPVQRLGVLMIIMLGACAMGVLVIMMSILPSCVRTAEG